MVFKSIGKNMIALLMRAYLKQQLLDQVVMELSPHYQEWIDKLCSNPRSPEWLMPLLALGADKMADLTVRTLMREWLISNIWNESREAGFLNPAFLSQLHSVSQTVSLKKLLASLHTIKQGKISGTIGEDNPSL